MKLSGIKSIAYTVHRSKYSSFQAAMSTSTAPQAGPGPSSLRNLKPPSRLGMQELDRTAFNLDVPILSIKVKASDIDRYRSDAAFRRYVTVVYLELTCRCLLDIPKTKMVVSTPDDSEYKLLRLRMDNEGKAIRTNAWGGPLIDRGGTGGYHGYHQEGDGRASTGLCGSRLRALDDP